MRTGYVAVFLYNVDDDDDDDDDSKGKGNPFLTSPATCTC